jgi:hypothetical protein
MKRYLLLFLGLGVLIAFMKLVLLPLVMEVVASDAFLVQSKDEGSHLSISNSMTDMAFSHCNSYIKSELGADSPVTFPAKPLKAWGFGNYQYILHSEFSVGGATKNYACRITYQNGDNLEGIADIDNWSIDGVTGIE